MVMKRGGSLKNLMMEQKVKHLLKWIEISKEKADDVAEKIGNEDASSGVYEFGKANAFSDCILKVKEIFET